MSPIILRIVLHGLVALVPVDSATSANQMKALLVDAHAFPSEVDPVLHPNELPVGYAHCFVPHMPMLTVDANDPNQCRAVPGCKINPTTFSCECMLSRQDVTLEVTPALNLQMRNLNSPPTRLPLPFDVIEAASFHYVANLTTSLNQQLDPHFLDTVPPDILAARMTFPFDSVTSCALAVRSEEGGRNVHALSFQAAGILEKSGDPSQALAQQVVSTLPIPDGASVVIKVRDFASSTELPIVLAPNADGSGYRIELSNMRKEDTLVDDPCDDGIARDFAFFYELALNKPPGKERRVPQIKMTNWKSAAALEQPQECKKPKKAPSSPP